MILKIRQICSIHEGFTISSSHLLGPGTVVPTTIYYAGPFIPGMNQSHPCPFERSNTRCNGWLTPSREDFDRSILVSEEEEVNCRMSGFRALSTRRGAEGNVVNCFEDFLKSLPNHCTIWHFFSLRRDSIAGLMMDVRPVHPYFNRHSPLHQKHVVDPNPFPDKWENPNTKWLIGKTRIFSTRKSL